LVLFSLLLLTWPALAGAEDPVAERTNTEKGAVCLLDEQEFVIKGKNKAQLRVHRIFRIFNQRGKDYGRHLIRTNKFKKVGKIKAQVLGPDGALIRELKKGDIKEQSPFSHYVRYADDKIKHFGLSATAFPYTVEYSYEVKYKSLFFWPDWYPQREIPVERSVYRLTLPEDLAFKTYASNVEVEPTDEREKGKRQLTFELTRIPPFEPEENMSPQGDHVMAVLFAPEQFELEGYKGSADSWGAFGRWYASLARRQYELSPERQHWANDLTRPCVSTKEKVRTLYRFLQRKTHYVAIELGIGGYQPRDAESVLATGYGDCKDLATLFIAMLGATGIRAYPALIRTQSRGTVLPDFPSSQFNHVIAQVPLQTDTLWFDCTLNYCPFGELPFQDEGCHALVVMQDTALLIRTPTSTAHDNRFSGSINGKLAPDGSLEITGTLTATGNYESGHREFLNECTAAEKREWLGRLIGKHAPHFTLSESDFTKISDLEAPFAIEFSAKFLDYPTSAGNELLLNPNLLIRVDAGDVLSGEKREYPVDNGFPSTEEVQVVLDIPPGLTVKAVPEQQDLTFPFGSFQTRHLVSGDQLIYKRTLTLNQRLIQPTDFGDYKAFLGKIYAADQSFVVFSRTE
jgi:transglutaminase-like putative cysteine protease